jgi:hypothetical protein
MRTSIASVLRNIVAFLNVNNLKEYLNKAQGVLPSGSNLKSIIVKEILNKPNLTSQEIRDTYQKLKGIIKGYKPLSNRLPFQEIILKPLQAFFESKYFIPTGMLDEIRDSKKILVKTEKELEQAQNLTIDTLQKGTPQRQIKPHTQITNK